MIYIFFKYLFTDSTRINNKRSLSGNGGKSRRDQEIAANRGSKVIRAAFGNITRVHLSIVLSLFTKVKQRQNDTRVRPGDVSERSYGGKSYRTAQ